MAKEETNILKRVMVAISSVGRVFRNNTGMFTTENGDKIRTGLCKGSSDLIGWVPIEITEGMVGKRIAIFIGIEVKSARGRESEQQINFRTQVNSSGGISFVARSAEEADKTLQQRIKDIQNART